MILDPAALTRDLTIRMCREAQFRAFPCSNGPEAITAIDNHPERFAAILIAAGLEERNGLELANQLCGLHPGLRPKLFLQLAPANQTAVQARCRELGLNNPLGWPLDYDDLRARVHQLLAGSPGLGDAAAVRPSEPAVQSRLHVLLVEDNVVNQAVLTRMLQRKGHTVLNAENGIEALSRLDEIAWAVDLILMDIQMPKMDGYQATAKIREHEQACGGHLPIVAVTAHAMASDAESCFLAGMDAFLSKPVRPDALWKTIASVVAHTAESSPELHSHLM